MGEGRASAEGASGLAERTAVAFASNRQRLRQLLGAMGPDWTGRGTTHWDSFPDFSEPASAVVVGLTDGDEELISRVEHWRVHRPGTPLILVMNKDEKWIPLLVRAGVRASAVIWWRKLDPGLSEALERWSYSRFVRIVEDELRVAGELTRQLEAALRYALRRRPPVSSVRRWSEEVDVSRTTIYRHWRQSFGPAPPLRPKEFLEWLVLLRGWRARQRGARWKTVARRVSVSLRTLSRVCRRRMDRSLTELSRVEGPRDNSPSGRFVEAVRLLIRGEKGASNNTPRSTRVP